MSEGHAVSIQNRQARHEYTVLESFEAGISLSGTEVKSIRGGQVNLKEAYCAIEDGQIFIKQMHISPYEKGNVFNKDPIRARPLLMHKVEIRRLLGQVKQKGLTLIPLSVYSKGRLIKVNVALCRGKNVRDKREDDAKRDATREMQKIIKERNA